MAGAWSAAGLGASHFRALAVAAVAAAALALGLDAADAQRRSRNAPAAPPPARQDDSPKPVPQPALPVEPAETVQADVSARSVAITSSFTGVEIVVFGAVDNSRQSSAESGLYDVVIVFEGTPGRLVARRKSNVAGMWINTQSVTFESVPSYYAIASTRPLDEVADPLTLRENDIGFDHVRMVPIKGWETGLSTADMTDFKSSVIRLKQKDGLYLEAQYGVVFVGRSLFRTTMALPANIPVGPLVARVYLFREGKLLHRIASQIIIEREGLELLLHSFAFGLPFLYGVFTVAVAVGAGLLASALFRRMAGH